MFPDWNELRGEGDGRGVEAANKPDAPNMCVSRMAPCICFKGTRYSKC